MLAKLSTYVILRFENVLNLLFMYIFIIADLTDFLLVGLRSPIQIFAESPILQLLHLIYSFQRKYFGFGILPRNIDLCIYLCILYILGTVKS